MRRAFFLIAGSIVSGSFREEFLELQAERAMMAAETNPLSTKTPPVASKSHPAHRNGAQASESMIKPPSASEPPPILVTRRSDATLLSRARRQVPNAHRMRTTERPIHPGRRGMKRQRHVSS